MRTPHSFLCVLVQVKVPEVRQNLILHSFHVVIITFKINPILIPIEFQYTSTTESCLGFVPCAGLP